MSISIFYLSTLTHHWVLQHSMWAHWLITECYNTPCEHIDSSLRHHYMGLVYFDFLYQYIIHNKLVYMMELGLVWYSVPIYYTQQLVIWWSLVYFDFLYQYIIHNKLVYMMELGLFWFSVPIYYTQQTGLYSGAWFILIFRTNILYTTNWFIWLELGLVWFSVPIYYTQQTGLYDGAWFSLIFCTNILYDGAWFSLIFCTNILYTTNWFIWWSLV